MNDSMPSSPLQYTLMLISEYFGQLGLAHRNNFEEIVVAVDLVPLHEVSQAYILVLTEHPEELFLLKNLFLLDYF